MNRVPDGMVNDIVDALVTVLSETPSLSLTLEATPSDQGKQTDEGCVTTSAKGVTIRRVKVEHYGLACAGADGGTNPCVFETVNDAVKAARDSFIAYRVCSLADRRRFIQAIRDYCAQDGLLDALAEATVLETGMGVADHKRWKSEIAARYTPGVEDLTCAAYSGDNGLTTIEYGPFGVIGAITPTTNPTATIIHNTIAMLAAGNTVIFSPHPRAKAVSIALIRNLNRVMREAGAPDHLIVTVANPGREATQELFTHPDINLIVATGGAALVRAAMQSGKKVIGAGAGNPPVVVDHTADIPHAAKCIVEGASFDNNLPCIAEKAIVAVDSVADFLHFHMEQVGAYVVRDQVELKALEGLLLDDANKGKGEWIGQSAADILTAIGVTPPAGVRLITVEVGLSHPFIVNELMMPVLGLVRVRSVAAAIELAVRIEGGNRHTAVMHSRDITALTAMGRRIDTTIFVKNGPSFAGLGMGGEGYPAFTIAGPTGEGLTSPRSFARIRRCALVGDLHMK